MLETEPIGVVAWAEVKRHGRTLYVRLSDLDIQLYCVQPGDKLKVELHSIFRSKPQVSRKYEEKTE